MNKYKNIITQKNNSLKQFLKLQKIVLTKKKVTKFAHTVKKACIHTIFILDVGILLYLVIAHTNVLTFIIFASATRTAPVILYKINHPAISCYFQIQQLKFHWYHFLLYIDEQAKAKNLIYILPLMVVGKRSMSQVFCLLVPSLDLT